MSKLVRLWKRPCKQGREFKYVLIWYDEDNKERWQALGHNDPKKAEKQRIKKERELRMGFVESGTLRLRYFLEDSIERSRGQVRLNTLRDYRSTMNHFIKVVGNIDYRKIKHKHGERFIQACLDGGNSPATARKKVGNLKRLFQLAVQRGQLDENPFQYLRRPKVPKRPIHIYSEDECIRLINAAKDPSVGGRLRWDLLIQIALCTGMRRGELLNTTWRDVDFAGQKIHVSPKKDTLHTWEWNIKDTDRRTLPLPEELIQLLAEYQAEHPVGYPYVFVPPFRYDHIQGLRKKDKWTTRHGNSPLNNFGRSFKAILRRAGIETGQFHDLRRTCLTGWFAHGLSEFDVMNMAGHANFETTRKFYLAIRDDLLERTRTASAKAMQGIFIANSLQVPLKGKRGKGRQA